MTIRTYEEACIMEVALHNAIQDLTHQEATEANKRRQRLTRAHISIAKRLHQVALRKCRELRPVRVA